MVAILLHLRRIPCVLPQTTLLFSFRRCQSTISGPLYEYIGEKTRGKNIAIQDNLQTTTYNALDSGSNRVAKALSNVLTGQQHAVSFLCGNDSSYAHTLFGIWKSGNIAVPLCVSHPPPLLEYYVKDSESSLIITTKHFVDKIHAFADSDKVVLLEDILQGSDTNDTNIEVTETSSLDDEALILYTSGTTGSPKGVVHTHDSIRSQVNSMLGPWRWTQHDNILHILPLHHTHGLVNCLLCPLAVGARVRMLPKFEASSVWELLLSSDGGDGDVNVFMAVPAVYAKLIEYYRENESSFSDLDVRGILMKNIRLMVSGSAALPLKVLNEWNSISGHTLLERYGMTEIGMALGNPYETSLRLPGFVGTPFPGVEVRITESDTGKILVSGDSNESEILDENESVSGNLQVRGSTVFKNYYNRDEATKKEFTEDGWFKTGDIASFEATTNSYKIVGRSSVDIIKSGGYKIGALDIERVLLEHDLIKDVAVVGVEDATWGQRVGAVVVVKGEGGVVLDLNSLRTWCKERMSSYSVPTLLKVMDALPRNAMGKVNKKQLVKIAFPE